MLLTVVVALIAAVPETLQTHGLFPEPVSLLFLGSALTLTGWIARRRAFGTRKHTE